MFVLLLFRLLLLIVLQVCQIPRQYQRGLSVFLRLVITVLKQRSSPKKLVYGDNKNFDRLTIKRELEEKLNQQINECKHFEQIFTEAPNMHAPIKRELLRANHVP